MRKTWCQSLQQQNRQKRGENKTPSKDETIVDTSKRREK